LRAFFRQAAGKNCGRIVERFCVHNSSTVIPCRPCLSRVCKIFLQFFYNFSTIFLQFFHNSSLCGRIWCIRIGLEKNCRRNNCRTIVEIFGECRPRGNLEIRVFPTPTVRVRCCRFALVQKKFPLRFPPKIV
jgi:hypothetical protein